MPRTRRRRSASHDDAPNEGSNNPSAEEESTALVAANNASKRALTNETGRDRLLRNTLDSSSLFSNEVESTPSAAVFFAPFRQMVMNEDKLKTCFILAFFDPSNPGIALSAEQMTRENLVLVSLGVNDHKEKMRAARGKYGKRGTLARLFDIVRGGQLDYGLSLQAISQKKFAETETYSNITPGLQNCPSTKAWLDLYSAESTKERNALEKEDKMRLSFYVASLVENEKKTKLFAYNQHELFNSVHKTMMKRESTSQQDSFLKIGTLEKAIRSDLKVSFPYNLKLDKVNKSGSLANVIVELKEFATLDEASAFATLVLSTGLVNTPEAKTWHEENRQATTTTLYFYRYNEKNNTVGTALNNGNAVSKMSILVSDPIAEIGKVQTNKRNRLHADLKKVGLGMKQVGKYGTGWMDETRALSATTMYKWTSLPRKASLETCIISGVPLRVGTRVPTSASP